MDSTFNDFLTMCAGSVGLAFFVMMFAANASRAIKKAVDEE